MFVTLFDISVTRTDGMRCEWNNPCGRKSAYCLADEDNIGELLELLGLNLCTQHTKIAMKRYTGQAVMAEQLEEAVKWEEACRKAAVRGYCAGWDDAMESKEVLY